MATNIQYPGNMVKSQPAKFDRHVTSCIWGAILWLQRQLTNWRLRSITLLLLSVVSLCPLASYAEPLDFTFATPIVITNPDQIIQMPGTVTNVSNVPITINGFGFNQDTLVGMWSAIPNRILGPGPYLLDTIENPFSGNIITLLPSESLDFNYGTLFPIFPPIPVGTY